MRKWISNIAGVLFLALGVVAKYGGWFMDALEIPEIPQKIKSIASFYTPGHTPYYLMAFATIFLVAVNWKSIKDWLNAENKPSQPQKPAPKIERDVWLLHALYYVGLGAWDLDEGSDIDQLNLFFDAETKIMEAAVNGDLPIWGKQSQHAPFEPIPKEYWVHAKLDYDSFFSNNGQDLRVEPSQVGYHLSVEYVELKTSRVKVEELWPQEGRA